MNNSKIHVVHELIRRGLMQKSEIIDGGLTVADSTSRHRNSLVMRKAGAGYFVKEAVPTQPMSVQTLMREAATYALVQQANGTLAPLAAMMPRCHVWDPVQRLLVLELLPGAENLAAHARRTNRFSETLAAQFGCALATYHGRAAGTLTQTTHGHIFPGMIPWALTISQQTQSSVLNLSGANAQMLSLVQRYPNFPKRLDALQASWRRDTLIHGDMKFENCVLAYTNGTDQEPEIKVVDWEIADLGDPRWDAGSMLQSWLSCWIFSMPADGVVNDPEQLVARAHYPLEAMQPAMRAFWRAYAETMGVSGTAERDLLDTCISFGAARMIQTVFESMYQMTQLTPHAIFMLQVSLNILEEPRAAVSELMAL
ncbi:Phosphotransferase enzyme family protein [Luteitalea pratensis]|uniref:Phosphotransferase enzyme family protein n=1 Tax=Luteitalea pratensis TaxID=1855912 RepID=A0A143PMG4_LUTPR|nr:phosphotransferase [Luteitalea pratensis]AMY09268.1 Phosphotransferase enzyme family protein [Luteitalea pratensis]